MHYFSPGQIKRWTLLFPVLCTAVFAFSQAQNYTIQGNVTSADGEPLIGATVLVVGQQAGTV
ncbi:MAG: hypothetical protein R3330_18805, partial [Saprospiraceae bacterium]|nr:hypothetical protein [Saprospiraceae bacterium]